MKESNDGFIIKIFDWVLSKIKFLSLVEMIKKLIFTIIKPKEDTEKKRLGNNIIDFFIMFKWLLILILIFFKIKNLLCTILITYLLIFNVYTYFYYHVWSESAVKSMKRTVANIKRRFISLMLSFGFVILVYAYYYLINFNINFKPIDGNFSYSICSLYHSFASAFVGGSDLIIPTTNLGLFIQSSQILITFIYVGIIFNKSDEIKEDEDGLS